MPIDPLHALCRDPPSNIVPGAAMYRIDRTLVVRIAQAALRN
jgi:hypothetical protein